ncbi:glycosyltransferase family 2 protein [Pelagibacterales bacterium SAG-MED15]|nr:glycosyltransferase family 2 protein [Pelagibacterales bacterium SAG-MED15]
MKDLTLIIPAKKEAESLPIFLEEIRNYECKKLIVLQKEDFETKKSIEKIRNIQIHEQKNNGYGNALIEGINNVKTKYCCIINADGSMDPKYLKEMQNGITKIDLVFGSRYQKPGGGSEDDDLVTSIGNFFFTFIGNVLFNLKITDILYTFILGKTSSFKNLNLQNSDFRICVEIPIKAKFKNMKYLCLPSYERERIGGKKKVNALKDGLLILTEIVKYFFRLKR